MSTAPATRPPAVLIYCIFALVLVVWCAVSTFNLIRVGDIAPIAYGLVMLGLILGVIGFWLMRWWGVVLGLLAAGYVAFFSVFHVSFPAQAAMIAYAAPMLIIAFLCRAQFK